MHLPTARHPHAAPRTTLLALVLALSPHTFISAAPDRIGVYDSRAIAYAYFWSEAGAKAREALVDDVRSARFSNDAARLERAEDALRDYDGRTHLAVFSTAPAEEALAALSRQIPDVLAQTGTIRLVSKWGSHGLAQTPDAGRVDVTQHLVALFNLPPNKLHVIDAILSHDPIPLERAQALWRAGKL